MKIAFIIHSLGIGGMERVMLHLINNISKYENVEIHLILIGKKREILFTLPSNIIVHKPVWLFNEKLRFIEIIKTCFFIRKTIIQINPITILSFGEYWNNIVLLSLFGIKNKIFISDRSKPNKNLGLLHNYLKKKLYPCASGLIVQTEKAYQYSVNKKLNKNIKIINNPIEEFSENMILRENIVLTVGRLINTKNIDHLIDIFIGINNNNWKLVIIG